MISFNISLKLLLTYKRNTYYHINVILITDIPYRCMWYTKNERKINFENFIVYSK